MGLISPAPLKIVRSAPKALPTVDSTQKTPIRNPIITTSFREIIVQGLWDFPHAPYPSQPPKAGADKQTWNRLPQKGAG
jgi:hypothetical protein